jgi:hypothetical protein
MTQQSRSRVPLRTLIVGFEESRRRFDTITGGASSDEVFVALFDVVAWAGAICDWYSHPSRKRKVPELEGFWFVRNRILHDGAEAFLHTTGFGLGRFGHGPFGVGEGTWTWKRRARLTKPPKGKGTRGRDEYDVHLAGKTVSATLEALSLVLAPRTRH